MTTAQPSSAPPPSYPSQPSDVSYPPDPTALPALPDSSAAILDQLAAISAQLAAANAYLADLRDIDPNRRVDANLVQVKLSFFAWVDLLVKIALASIPAMIIVAAALFFLLAILGVVFGIGILGR